MNITFISIQVLIEFKKIAILIDSYINKLLINSFSLIIDLI